MDIKQTSLDVLFDSRSAAEHFRLAYYISGINGEFAAIYFKDAMKEFRQVAAILGFDLVPIAADVKSE